jgi:hypothetical protein
MTTAAMVTYAYDQIDQARTEFENPGDYAKVASMPVGMRCPRRFGGEGESGLDGSARRLTARRGR